MLSQDHFSVAALSLGLTLATRTSEGTACGRWQQADRNPPQPPCRTPPVSQQNRKNSHEPVLHSCWLRTNSVFRGGRILSRGGGGLCCGRGGRCGGGPKGGGGRRLPGRPPKGPQLGPPPEEDDGLRPQNEESIQKPTGLGPPLPPSLKSKPLLSSSLTNSKNLSLASSFSTSSSPSSSSNSTMPSSDRRLMSSAISVPRARCKYSLLKMV